MSNKLTTAVLVAGAAGAGWMLYRNARGGAQQDRVLDEVLAAINGIVSAPVAVLNPAGSTGVTVTTPLTAPQLAASAPSVPQPAVSFDGGVTVFKELIAPIVNLAKQTAYQPVLQQSGEVIFHGGADGDWVMRNGAWVRV